MTIVRPPMHTLHLSSGDSVDVFVPITSFVNGAPANPTAQGWTVQLAVRVALTNTVLAYAPATWEFDQYGIPCARIHYTLADGRWELWAKVTTQTDTKETFAGVIIVGE